LEQDAQEVWRRRCGLHASDLVRFGRTSDFWRNRHVTMLDTDKACAVKLQALANPQMALDLAIDAGTRAVAIATVLSTAPLRLKIDSRRIGEGSSIVALHIDGHPAVESDSVTLKILKGSFKFGRMAVGELSADRRTPRDQALLWNPPVTPSVTTGSTLIVADSEWFSTFANGHEIAIGRPQVDTVGAPGPACDESSYVADPDNHRYCCRPHEQVEAEIADWLADRRARGELNPQTWPPLLDTDQFDISPKGAPTSEQVSAGASDRRDPDLTIDELD